LNFQTEQQEEIKPWKKELIISLFKQQKILRVVFLIALIPAIALFLRLFFSGLSLYRVNENTFSWIQTPCVIESVDWQLFGSN
jgi:membrane protein insertase Oxa1/YidC/SpoIIIJ